jgi:hypothetical protein
MPPPRTSKTTSIFSQNKPCVPVVVVGSSLSVSYATAANIQDDVFSPNKPCVPVVVVGSSLSVPHFCLQL